MADIVPSANLSDKQPNNKNLNRGRWLKGESGNPKGRPPKDVCITSRVKELLLRDAGDGKTYADLVAQVIVDGLVDKAINLKNGINVPLIRELLDRTEGKVTQPIGGDDKLPLYVIHCTEEGRSNIERVMDGDRT